MVSSLQLLALGLFGQVSVEEQEEGLHLGIEGLISSGYVQDWLIEGSEI
jgi:hypothetical protein